jgi:acyl-CoA thioesterase-1
VVVVLFAALVVGVLSVHVAARAGGAQGGACARFAADSAARAAQVTGSGQRVVVVGDSWSVGYGLDGPVSSWAARLPGRVRVAGFSGSGFSVGASPCDGVSFAQRAAEAVDGGADLVVVAGGLNDFDQPSAAIRLGFERLLSALAGHRVVVVGPASAPSRAGAVPRVDALLASLAREFGVGYVRTTDLELEYLPDGLHLTPAGHRAFGDAVAARLARL